MSDSSPVRVEVRFRTVEFDGWGWIARNPWTGKEVWEGFRWASRSVARAVVAEARLFNKPLQRQTPNSNSSRTGE